jgi:hypothetical protein
MILLFYSSPLTLHLIVSRNHSEAVVEVDGGESHFADIVIAADGLNSMWASLLLLLHPPHAGLHCAPDLSLLSLTGRLSFCLLPQVMQGHTTRCPPTGQQQRQELTHTLGVRCQFTTAPTLVSPEHSSLPP